MTGTYCVKCLSDRLSPLKQIITKTFLYKRKVITSILDCPRTLKQQFSHVPHRCYSVKGNTLYVSCHNVNSTPILVTNPKYESTHTAELQTLNENEAGDKRIELTKSAQKKLLKMKPQQPLNPHILKTSVIGSPNAGKSTLVNQLTGWQFASVSKKVHTTRHNAVGVLTHNNTQVVFLDTPGLITPEKVKKHRLEKSLLTDPYSSLFDADLIITVVDVSQSWNRSKLDHEILTALMMHSNKRSILVLNKVDLLKCKSDLLTTARLLTEGVIGGKPAPHVKNMRKHERRKEDILKKILEKEGQTNAELSNTKVIESSKLGNAPVIKDEHLNEDWWNGYLKKLKELKRQAIKKRGWQQFDRVFMISAIDGDGLDDIKQYLTDTAIPGPWLYHSAVVTDQDPVELVKFCIRGKILDYLPKEIPYQIEVNVKQWELDENNYLRASIDLICPRSRDLTHLIGKEGQNISTIREEAKQELMNIFQQELSLHLNAYVNTKSD